jgi:hypothetical protein
LLQHFVLSHIQQQNRIIAILYIASNWLIIEKPICSQLLLQYDVQACRRIYIKRPIPIYVIAMFHIICCFIRNNIYSSHIHESWHLSRKRGHVSTILRKY